MSSRRQIDANRRNAQLSTGPQTPEGRAAVRSNALRHGLTAKIAVLDNENPEHFQEMLDAFRAEHQPVGPTEDLLVQQIVMAAWRLQRLRGVETGLFNLRMRALNREIENEFGQPTGTERHAFVFRDDTRNSHAIENLFRYECRIERSFYKALHELQRLQADRPPMTDPVEPADPAPIQDVPPGAHPDPRVEVTESAEQTHFQNRTPPLVEEKAPSVLLPAGKGEPAGRQRCHSYSPLQPLDANLLELGPIAGAVGL
jgi:hypothetical protein